MTVGTETYPIVHCSLRGNTLLFSVERMGRGGKELFSYEGQVSGDTIQGKITPREPGQGAMRWQATRDPSTIVSIAE
jgi:hypothetical protein